MASISTSHPSLASSCFLTPVLGNSLDDESNGSKVPQTLLSSSNDCAFGSSGYSGQKGSFADFLARSDDENGCLEVLSASSALSSSIVMVVAPPLIVNFARDSFAMFFSVGITS
jgi:hypothetical protein